MLRALSLWVSPVPGGRGHRLTWSPERKYTCSVCLCALNDIILAELLNLHESSQLEDRTMFPGCVPGTGDVRKVRWPFV